MTERNLLTAKCLCELENLLPPLPGTEKTLGFAPLTSSGGLGVETGGDHMQLNVVGSTEVGKVSRVSLIRDVLHPHMHGTHLEARAMDEAAPAQQLGEQQRVLAARQGDEHVVAVGNEPELGHCLRKLFLQPQFQWVTFHRDAR